MLAGRQSFFQAHYRYDRYYPQAPYIRQRETTSNRRLPIVALTAMAAAKDREQCQAAGMDDCLLKPIRLPELARVLRWACEQKQARADS